MDTNDDVHHPGSLFGHKYQKALLVMVVCKSGTDRALFLVHITAWDAQDVRNMSGLDHGRKICIFSEGEL